VPFGVRYFERVPDYLAPAPLAEFAIAPGLAATAAYGEGWAPQQWDAASTWRWARGESAVIVVRNPTAQPQRVQLRLLAGTVQPRELAIAAGDHAPLRFTLTGGRQIVALPALDLAPGETRLVFRTPQPDGDSIDTTPGRVTFKVEAPRLEPR
jgi:hypothetical protein